MCVHCIYKCYVCGKVCVTGILKHNMYNNVFFYCFFFVFFSFLC